jgi:hypothetical protein
LTNKEAGGYNGSMRLFYLLFLLPCCVVARLFNHPLTLEEFGLFPNTIASLQPEYRFNYQPGLLPPPLRTNDFHALQLTYGAYPYLRPITRIGAFLISAAAKQAPDGYNGIGVAFPVRCTTRDNPALSIAADPEHTRLVLSSIETLVYTLTNDLKSSETAQSLTLTYTHPADPNRWMRDYNIVGNAFHDVLYHALSPILTCDAHTRLQEITVFSAAFPQGRSFLSSGTLPPGHKFRLTLRHTPSSLRQTWLLYVEQGGEIAFDASFEERAFLRGRSPLSGWLRLAIVQPEPVPYFPEPQAPPAPFREWATALGIQIIGATPASLFLLWPAEFIPSAVQLIKQRWRQHLLIPSCTWLSLYLPLIARVDLTGAQSAFRTLRGVAAGALNALRAERGPDAPTQEFLSETFDVSTNPFLSYFHMLLSARYRPEIEAYQKQRRPPPPPSVPASAASIEALYDAHRSAIPTRAEIRFEKGRYQWTYATERGDPLILFPAYKRHPPLPGFVIQDPIKGPLYALSATGGIASFYEGGLPPFLHDAFLPMDCWERFSSKEQRLLTTLLDPAVDDLRSFLHAPLPEDYADNGYSLGKILFQAGLTLRYAAYVWERAGLPREEVKRRTEGVASGIKQTLEAWLIGRQTAVRAEHQGAIPPCHPHNFFVGDSTGRGVCYSVTGMQAGSNVLRANESEGNAYYNDHHFQYGYWLAAAAAVVEWDNRYEQERPWIAKQSRTATGAGPLPMKAFVDLLWRDTHNPDPDDPDLPYNRHGNPWEGHSTANGLPLTPPGAGRNQESLAEDFQSWLALYSYAQAILRSPALGKADTQGFQELAVFAETHLCLTATAGALYFNTPQWPYRERGMNANPVCGNQWDSTADAGTFFSWEGSPCTVPLEQ